MNQYVPERPEKQLQTGADVESLLPRGLIRAGRAAVGCMRSIWSHRAVRVAAASLALALLVPAAVLLHHVYLDRSDLPDLEPFIRFEPPTIGRIYDAQGGVLIELAREHRQVVSYDEMPLILRQAILAAEDKNFFSHSGVDYRVLPRVVLKVAESSFAAWRQRRRPDPAAVASGWLDAHAAARPRLLPPRPDEPRERRRSLPRRADGAASRRRPWEFRPRTSFFASSRRCA